MSEGSPSGKLIRVLVVDDDQDLLFVLSSYLARRYEVRAASSGHQALEIVREWTPHTLVTDIRMPNMNGFMLLREIMKIVPGIHTIALSANFDPGDSRAMEVVGPYAERALGKPLHPDKLIQVIEEILDGDADREASDIREASDMR